MPKRKENAHGETVITPGIDVGKLKKQGNVGKSKERTVPGGKPQK